MAKFVLKNRLAFLVVWSMVLTLVFAHTLSASPPVDLLEVEAVALSDAEMGEVRGGYAGFYFAFDFSGFWDNTGGWGGTSKAQGSATYNTEVGDIKVVVNDSNGTTAATSSTTGPTDMPVSSVTTLSTGDKAVRMQAFVGEINQTQGVIQICQVPGSNNVVTTVMNLQLTVININDPSRVAQLPSILPGLIGN